MYGTFQSNKDDCLQETSTFFACAQFFLKVVFLIFANWQVLTESSKSTYTHSDVIRKYFFDLCIRFIKQVCYIYIIYTSFLKGRLHYVLAAVLFSIHIHILWFTSHLCCCCINPSTDLLSFEIMDQDFVEKIRLTRFGFRLKLIRFSNFLSWFGIVTSLLVIIGGTGNWQWQIAFLAMSNLGSFWRTDK